MPCIKSHVRGCVVHGQEYLSIYIRYGCMAGRYRIIGGLRKNCVGNAFGRKKIGNNFFYVKKMC